MKLLQINTHWRTCDRTTLMTDDGHGIIEIEYPKDHPNVGYIWNLWVEEPYRNAGIGRTLIQAAEDAIKAEGKKIIALEWDKRDCKPHALDWYLRRGYNDTEFDQYGCKLVKKI